MTSRTTTYCALAALAVGLAACASTSEPARTVAAASRSSDASTADALTRIAERVIGQRAIFLDVAVQGLQLQA